MNGITGDDLLVPGFDETIGLLTTGSLPDETTTEGMLGIGESILGTDTILLVLD